MRFMVTLLVTLLLVCFTGCLQSTPPELKDLCPVEIQVLRDGKPVEGVSVALYDEEPKGVVGCNAVTNRQGIAVPKTSIRTMSAKGVRPGRYQVVFAKEVVWPDDLADFEADLPDTLAVAAEHPELLSVRIAPHAAYTCSSENLKKAHELKVIVETEKDFEWAEECAGGVSGECMLFLQPEWSRAGEMVPQIVEYAKDNPRWNISLQTHKYMHIP